MQPERESSSAGLLQRRQDLARAVVDRHIRRAPHLGGRGGHEKVVEDAAYHLDFLAEAVSTGSPALFLDYVSWSKIMLTARGVPQDDLSMNLECLETVLREQEADESLLEAAAYVERALQQLADMPGDVPAAIRPGDPYADKARAYLDALLASERRQARQIILDAVEKGIAVREIYTHVFGPAQHEVGRLWQINEISVAQEHFCTAATQLIMSQLYSHIFSTERIGKSVVATTIGGDLHEIGIRMVSDFFEMEGWDTFYLGANSPAEDVVSRIKSELSK